MKIYVYSTGQVGQTVCFPHEMTDNTLNLIQTIEAIPTDQPLRRSKLQTVEINDVFISNFIDSHLIRIE